MRLLNLVEISEKSIPILLLRIYTKKELQIIEINTSSKAEVGSEYTFSY